MGKYMRKRKRGVGRTTPAVELGVRTRARSAAVASVATAAAAVAPAPAPAPKRKRKRAAARAETDAEAEAEAEAAVRGKGGGAASACCYLQLRSRRLFMPAGEMQWPVPPLPAAAVQRSVASGEEEAVEVAAGISRCSSTASSLNVVLQPAMAPADGERSGGEAEEAREDCDVESVVSDSAGCCRRERRETTPSSRPSIDLSDEEWSQAADDPDPKRLYRRRMALATTATTSATCRARMMPPAGDIEEFFGAAEKAQAERFAAKYNFDVTRGLPLGGGPYEWTPVASG